MQALVHSISNFTTSIYIIWAVMVENNAVLKTARQGQVIILLNNQALSGWLAQASHLTDPLLYVMYQDIQSDSAWPGSSISDNYSFFDQSTLLSDTLHVPVYNIGEEEDIEDSRFKEKPQSLTCCWAV